MTVLYRTRFPYSSLCLVVWISSRHAAIRGMTMMRIIMKNFAVKAVFTAMRDAWPCSSLYGLSLEASLHFLHGIIGWIMEDNPVQLVGIIAVLRFWCISLSAPYWWHMASMLFCYSYGWRCYSCTWSESYWPVKNNRQ